MVRTKEKRVAHKAIQVSASLMLLPHFQAFHDLVQKVLHRPKATWNLFVLYDKKLNVVHGDVKNKS